MPVTCHTCAAHECGWTCPSWRQNGLSTSVAWCHVSTCLSPPGAMQACSRVRGSTRLRGGCAGGTHWPRSRSVCASRGSKIEMSTRYCCHGFLIPTPARVIMRSHTRLHGPLALPCLAEGGAGGTFSQQHVTCPILMVRCDALCVKYSSVLRHRRVREEARRLLRHGRAHTADAYACCRGSTTAVVLASSVTAV